MSILFTPFNIGNLQIKNRFVLSACEDSSATDSGEVTQEIVKKNSAWSKGEIGLIISSHMSVHTLGRTRKKQLGIHDEALVKGLRELTDEVHQHEGKIVFQLGHAGLQTTAATIGRPPLGPSSDNPMTEGAIREVIASFVQAASRAAEAGADGVQVHAAHGYLINEFLSPFYNKRQDLWGGSEENCFRLLQEIIVGIKKILPLNMILMVKLNSNDYTPKEGITPTLATHYAKRIADLGIDGLEVSCGTSLLSSFNMCRGDVPVKELLLRYPESQRSQMKVVLKNMEGKYKNFEGYNVEASKMIRIVIGETALLAVGGWRHVSSMEEAINNGHTDFISMCRPFIREPSLVKKIREGKTTKASCTNCNRCLAALASNIPVQCYVNGIKTDKSNNFKILF
ncbi:MAG: NADH:flavin oxidoreductase [Deltaproteobacteria bacterium]